MENTENIKVVVEKFFGTDCDKNDAVVQLIEKVIDEADEKVARCSGNAYVFESAENQIRWSWFSGMQELFGTEKVTVNGIDLHFTCVNDVNGTEQLRFYVTQLFRHRDLHESVSGLQQIAKEKNYKPGWVWYRLAEKHGKLVASLLA